MEIVLLKDVSKVGRKLELVNVSEGYAINFLIPKGLAKAATPAAKKEVEMRKKTTINQQALSEEKITAGIKAIDGKAVTLHAKANEKGHLFAALHPDAIATAVYDQLGVSLPNDIFGEQNIKEIGMITVPLESHGKKGTLTVHVEKEIGKM